MKNTHNILFKKLDCFFAFVARAFVAIHIFMTIVYLLPPNPARNVFANSVQKYMGGLFDQNWHLFSPSPGKTYVRFEVNCGALHSATSQWQDAEIEKQSIHDYTRISSLSKSLHYYRNLGNSLWKASENAFQECLQSGLNAENCYHSSVAKVRESNLYLVAERYAKSACKKTLDQRVPFRVTLYKPISFSKRNAPIAVEAPATFSFSLGEKNENL